MSDTIGWNAELQPRARIVVGCFIDESEPNTKGNLFNYKRSITFFESVAKMHLDKTGGSSLLPVYVDHDTSKQVGIVRTLQFYKAAHAVNGVVEVTDDDAWARCEAGEFNAFSMGGSNLHSRDIVHKGVSVKHRHFFPEEVSLTGNPALKAARFNFLFTVGTEPTSVDKVVDAVYATRMLGQCKFISP